MGFGQGNDGFFFFLDEDARWQEFGFYFLFFISVVWGVCWVGFGFDIDLSNGLRCGWDVWIRVHADDWGSCGSDTN